MSSTTRVRANGAASTAWYFGSSDRLLGRYAWYNQNSNAHSYRQRARKKGHRLPVPQGAEPTAAGSGHVKERAGFGSTPVAELVRVRLELPKSHDFGYSASTHGPVGRAASFSRCTSTATKGSTS